MTFNYRTGLFRLWAVLSLLWVVVTALIGGMPWGAVVGLPLILGVALYLIVWIIRGFTKVQPSSEEFFDLQELRQNLASSLKTEYPELYRTKLEPLLDRLEAKYGNDVPQSEMEGLRQFLGEWMSLQSRDRT